MKRQFLAVVGLLAVLSLGCLSDGGGVGPNPPAPRQLAAVVMVVDETRADPLPSGVVVAMDSNAVQNYLATHTAKAADGKTPESKRYRKSEDLSAQSPIVQKLHAATVKKMTAAGGSDPFIGVAVNQRKFIVGKIPPGMESDGKTPKLLTLLKKYGGE